MLKALRRVATLVRRSVWVFLARSRFAAKTPAIEGWIHLDFLGFSRANLDFSMSYTDKSVKSFFIALFPGARSPGRKVKSWREEIGIAHLASLP